MYWNFALFDEVTLDIAINRNMRCIEMIEIPKTNTNKDTINRNMRCIEIRMPAGIEEQ